jgi:hypothetical protein
MLDVGFALGESAHSATMVLLSKHRDFQRVQTLPFCYWCGRKFLPTDESNRDHIPPKRLFAVDDRSPPLWLPTHDACNSKHSPDDQKIGPLIGVRWGRTSTKREQSRPGGGRPAIPKEIRDLIREMSRANWLWGAPRIHGELLKLGIEVGQSNRRQVHGQAGARHLRRRGRSCATMRMELPSLICSSCPRSDSGCSIVWSSWRTAGESSFIMPLRHPTAEWVARQIVEAFPWDTTPRHLVRDRDTVYGRIVKRRLRALGIRDRLTASRSPSERIRGAFDRLCATRVHR